MNGIQYNSYRDACYSLGLLDDDKEYIDGIIEASQWAIASSLRNLFVTLLQSRSMSRPEYVWEHTWVYLSEDILYQRRRKMRQPGMTYEIYFYEQKNNTEMFLCLLTH